MPQTANKPSDDAIIQYRTPMASAVHVLCVERLQRALKRLAEKSDTRGATVAETLDGTAKKMDADIVSLKKTLKTHGIGCTASFTAPAQQIVVAPGVEVARLLELLQRFDTLVEVGLTAYLHMLLPGDDMDRLFDDYVTEMLACSRASS